MCLIGIRLQTSGQLTIAANRDEFADRPTLPMHWWPEGILAGKDLKAGGTWLGMSRTGRCAAITNVRDPAIKNNPIPAASRGHLAADFLRSDQSPEEFLSRLRGKLSQPSAFNLLVGTVAADAVDVFWLGGRTREIQRLDDGCHVLSNAELNSPWPKALSLQQALMEAENERLIDALSDPSTYPDHELPVTGVSTDWERRLSAALITGSDYHTRSTSLIEFSGARLLAREITRQPDGKPIKEARFDLLI